MTLWLKQPSFVLVVFGLCGAVSPASATTEAERKLFKSPMPHEQYTSKTNKIKAHRVHLQGYLEGNPANEVRLAELKEQVRRCVGEHQRDGRPARPPTAWPDYLLSSREDNYSSRNRSIHYSSSIAYGVNTEDCSLLESASARAELVSSKGVCYVNLTLRTAKGVCDPDGHADAAVPPNHAKVPNSEALKIIMSDPRMAAVAASMKQAMAAAHTRTQQTRLVFGIECDVWDQPGAPGGGTACFARNGSFNPARTALNPGEAGMMLEYESKFGFKMKAVDAKLDAQIDPAVFTPYTQPGFIISAKRGQR